MNLIRWTIGFLVASIALMLLYPIYVRYHDGERREAYQGILTFHRANHAPVHISSFTRQKNKPFLYLSWFSTGDPRYADEFLAYPDGMIFCRRVLWNYAVQGGGSANQLPSTFRQLQSLPLLPPGIIQPADVPYNDLLIVSQTQNNVWHTYYYNRHHLPVPVISMLHLAGALGNVPTSDTNAPH